MHVAITTPVFNDWKCYRLLVAQILALPSLASDRITFVVVDDASSDPFPDDLIISDSRVTWIRLRLACNLGHQRAIAIGLQYVAQHLLADVTVVMDGDGEDRPEDIPRMIAVHRAQPNAIVCARRARRSEGLLFRCGYFFYRMFFRLLCGREIGFGNFAVIPRQCLDRIIYHPAAWNNLPATILRCRAPLKFVDADRGARFFGQSRLGLMNLTVHGLSAIAVFSDVVIGRLAAFAASCVAFSAVLGLLIIAAKLFTDVLIPGYATTVSLLLFSMSMQILFFSVVAILALLNGRSAPSFIVGKDADSFLAEVIPVSPPGVELRKTGT